MQILPTLPTDNIYKLKAIAGLWMLAGLFAFVLWFVYWQYQLEVQTRHTISYYSAVNTERDVLARIKSIQNGLLNENKLKWIPLGLSVTDEQNLLKFALANNRKIIALYKREVEEERGGFLFFLDEKAIIFAMSAYVLTMLYLLFFGFERWYRRIQSPSEKAILADNEIKRLTIEKINLEIALISKKERKPFKKRLKN